MEVIQKQTDLTYELTLDQFTRKIILAFTEENEAFKGLKRYPVIKWQAIAEMIGHSKEVESQKYYCLYAVADQLLHNPKKCNQYYEAHRAPRALTASAFGVVDFHIPSPTQINPLRTRIKSVAGIIISESLFYKQPHHCEGKIRRIPINSEDISLVQTYDTYFELSKNNPQFKQTKAVFNRIMKEKGV